MQYWTGRRDGGKGEVLKCRIGWTVPLSSETADALLKIRREAIAQREEMLSYQKQCGKSGDREGARFFKEEAADWMKYYRAACLLIPYHTSDHPGDCKYMREWDWPPDLFDHLDRVMSLASIAGKCIDA